MNLIDLYRKNPKCKVERIDDSGCRVTIDFKTSHNFICAISYTCLGDVSNTADDWEVVKVPRKIVIDNIMWTDYNGNSVIHPQGASVRDALSAVNNKNISCKMTLEFEE